MRAKLQCYFEAIVRVMDVPVRSLGRPDFLLIAVVFGFQEGFQWE
ncbi:hypothetical protein [Bartonella gliris]|nr:hypothetical protein [Bartonella gliris]